MPSPNENNNNQVEDQESTSNVTNLDINSCMDQKLRQDMLLSYTAAALALAKHRPNNEKSRAQRKQVEVEEEPKLRRNRTAFNDNQLDKLESCFQVCQYPTVTVRDRLAKETGLPESKIQVWYKNRRAKHRKHLRNLPADDNSSDDSRIQSAQDQESSLNVISWNPQLFGNMYSQFFSCPDVIHEKTQ